MSVIIRLQNLPWSANSYDIRQYFQGLSIPEGGVHIVGGELGDAFIAFSTDEDARQAMMRTGGKLKEVQVSLLLSSRTEMQRVIEAARSMTMPPVQPVMPPQQQLHPQQQPLPQQQLHPQQQSLPQQQLHPQQQSLPLQQRPGQLQHNIDSHESREPRKRSRSRSRERSRSDRRDGSRRKRSRSRDRRDDRRDDRDRGDRRRRRSRSRSMGRDRYGRDIEKRETALKDKPKDKNDRSRDKVVDATRKDSKDANPRQLGNAPTNTPSIPPAAAAATTNVSNPFGLMGNADGQQRPFIDDPLTAAMKSTLSALQMPIPPSLEKPIIPALGGDQRNMPQQAGQFGMQANKDVSRGHSGFPDPGPAFNDRAEPSNTFGGRPDLANPFGARPEASNSYGERPDPSKPFGARPEPPNMLGCLDPTNPFGARIDGPNVFMNNFQPWFNASAPQNEALPNMWCYAGAPFMPMGIPNNAYPDGNRTEFLPNQANMDTRGQGFPTQNNINGGNAPMDDDFRPRFTNLGGPFNQRNDAMQPDSTNLGRYGNDQNRFRSDNSRNPEFENDQFHHPRPNFDRPKYQDQPDNRKFDRDSDGRSGTRRDLNDHHRGGNERNRNSSPDRRNYEKDLNDLFAEISDCPMVSYKDIRRSFYSLGAPVEDIKFIYDGISKKRALLKFADMKGKMKAIRFRRGIRVGVNGVVSVNHISAEEFNSAARNALSDTFDDSPRRFNDGENRNRSRQRRSEENENKEFKPKHGDRNDGTNPMVWKREDGEKRKKDSIAKNENDVKEQETTASSLPKQNEPENGQKTKTEHPNHPSHCLFVSDLPLGTTDRDVFDFFSDVGITPNKLHLMLGSDGEPSGEAYVEFWDQEAANKGLVKNGAPMGRACISVRLAESAEMLDAVGPDGDNVVGSTVMPDPGHVPSPILPHEQHPRPQRGMWPGFNMGPFKGRFPAPSPLFPQETRFRPNKKQGPPARAPSPNRVLVLHNLPYRADVNEIVEFLGRFGEQVSVNDIYRRMNDRRQPTSEARIVLGSAREAEMAKNFLADKCIRDRPIYVDVLINDDTL